MDLKNILSISGKPGLYKNIGQSKSGVIVESITDGKRFPAFAHERISSLAEISIFTHAEDVSLADVFRKVYDKYEGKEVLDAKSDGAALRAFMLEVLPDYDEDRVYTSDIKKLVTWYNLLVANNMMEFTDEEAGQTQGEAPAEAPGETLTDTDTESGDKQ
ncbi:MAG: DUF5606 domain-containing protein [Bacteroidales bacterium]|jgi:hypothetical protein|nr:DUF5606 domain-containing protein [Bacteroidales bacterium]MDD4742669.1 DUF5606 domain-containing protein [Bacteroidales bacterium]